MTPLPWTILLAAVARVVPGSDAGSVPSPDVLFGIARVGSAVAGLVGILVLGARAASFGASLGTVFLAAAALASSVAVAPHLGTGMETGFALGLAAWGASEFRRPNVAAIALGVAATFRPELVPWASALSVGYAFVDPRHGGRERERAGASLVAACLALAPFACVVLLRIRMFGHAVPLAISAKPSDPAHGLVYVVGALVGSGAAFLLSAPVALPRLRGVPLVVALAAVVHATVIVAVGGDWMPYARLMAPIVPSLALGYVALAPHASRVSNVLRAGLAIAVGGAFLLGKAAEGRNVARDRAELVRAARPHLAGMRRVVALDVGWVSAATEASIVDLAGLTDPHVANLPGGHTSKRVDVPWLLAGDPDAVLVYAEPRVVERRITEDPRFMERFVPRAFLPLGTKGSGYALWTRR
ncbi:MAG: hypothetical protein U0169_07395 [Polyangiaceae bacterium]